ncbi:MAG: hypothetical protein WD749_01395 [Phycisphaerales bacterium]
MKGRRRRMLLRGAKWLAVAVAVTVTLAAAWLLSGGFGIHYGSLRPATIGGVHLQLSIAEGRFSMERTERRSGSLPSRTKWGLARVAEAPQWRGYRYARAAAGKVSAIRVDLPAWCAALIAAIPTAALWRFDRRARLPGLCPCGYALAGLGDDSPCPECGRTNPAR